MNGRQKQIEEKLSDLLPDSSKYLGSDGLDARKKLIEEKAKDINDKKTAQELARVRYNLKRELKAKQESQIAKQAVLEHNTAKELARREAIQEIIAEDTSVSAEEAIEIGNQVALQHGQPTISMASDTAKNILMMQGTTKPEVIRLLSRLNINMNLQLTKNDTANLLACLLTANETQLKAIYNNSKVPIAIKTVIKRLLDDTKLGDISTVEKLWDRIFGKAGMLLNLPEQTQQATGIIPNTPVSREAYIVIRDTLLK